MPLISDFMHTFSMHCNNKGFMTLLISLRFTCLVFSIYLLFSNIAICFLAIPQLLASNSTFLNELIHCKLTSGLCNMMVAEKC